MNCSCLKINQFCRVIFQPEQITRPIHGVAALTSTGVAVEGGGTGTAPLNWL